MLALWKTWYPYRMVLWEHSSSFNSQRRGWQIFSRGYVVLHCMCIAVMAVKYNDMIGPVIFYIYVYYSNAATSYLWRHVMAPIWLVVENINKCGIMAKAWSMVIVIMYTRVVKELLLCKEYRPYRANAVSKTARVLRVYIKHQVRTALDVKGWRKRFEQSVLCLIKHNYIGGLSL